jgi:hypothetical protein
VRHGYTEQSFQRDIVGRTKCIEQPTDSTKWTKSPVTAHAEGIDESGGIFVTLTSQLPLFPRLREEGLRSSMSSLDAA